jgi:hypothetical protein
MAGGPPHKGTFLEPGTRADIDANSNSPMQSSREFRRTSKQELWTPI